MRKLIIICLMLSASGCSVTYTADPANELTTYTREICVIEKPDVRDEFLQAYKKILSEKGFEVKVIPPASTVSACELTSDYIGKWSWDFKPYMATAKINLYEKGTLIASASYSSPRGGFSMTTKIYESTETKVRGMAEKLFPKI